jgi:site-specific DNA-cytosine methylase
VSYQKVTGPLMANSHPGSYCGQDAYSDMLITGDNHVGNGNRTGECRNHEGGCPTLNAAHEQPIYISTDKKKPSITEDGVGTTLTATEEDRPMVSCSTVRRLTPLECERLQGYPDGWTDIGDWVDSKGKTHKAADSPRYKALGNSIALPYWKVLLKRISAMYDRDATMASLFDGIGGFPLLWEQINGKGSCLWASEIEEFSMAVTKVRFGE